MPHHLFAYMALFCFALQSPFTRAHDAEPDKVLLFSYTAHPVVEQQLIPLLTQAYENLGYTPRFINVQSDRFMQLIQQHQVDGDVARTKPMIEMAGASAMLVYRFGAIRLNLCCRGGLRCETQMLYQPDELIYSPANSQIYQHMQLNFHARLETSKDWSQILQLYHAKKLDRFLWIDLDTGHSVPTTLPDTTIIAIPLPVIEIYHTLHQSKSALAPLISAELNRLQQIQQPQPKE